MIDEQHLHLAAIVGVDGAGRIEHGYAVLDGEAGARTHLSLVTGWQGDGEAGRHKSARARRDRQRRIDGGAQVEAGRVGGLRRGQRQAGAVRQPEDA